MAEARPAFCLERQTANRQTLAHSQTHRKKKKTGILLTSISLKASSVSGAAKTWESDGRVGETLGNLSDATNGLTNLKGRAPAWRDGQGKWSPGKVTRVGWSREGWCSGELEKIRAKRKPKSPCALLSRVPSLCPATRCSSSFCSL